MPLKDWERDVINRQRNIVFPDTVLNEGRMFRTLNVLKDPTPVQRFGFVLVALSFVAGGAFSLAVAIAELLSAKTAANFFTTALSGIVGVGFLAFGIVICIRAVFSQAPPQRKRRRRGYRQSSIQ